MQVHRDLDRLPTFRRPVVTIGSFDGVHVGHRELLAGIRARAAAIGGESVLVTFDPHPRHVVGGAGPPLRLLTTTEEKIDRLAALGLDHVVVVAFTEAFAAQSAEAYLRDFLFGRFGPHTVVIGYDHRYGKRRAGNIELLRQLAPDYGAAVDEIPARDVDRLAVSSTRIRRALAEGRAAEAARLLGDPFRLTGRVVHGDAIGRTIGFPTANLDLAHPYKLVPADGVYAVRATLLDADDGPDIAPLTDHPAMLYVGQRPSLAGMRPRTIEVNVIDYAGDLYGRRLRVALVARVRADQTFAGLPELRAQIERDRAATLTTLAAA